MKHQDLSAQGSHHSLAAATLWTLLQQDGNRDFPGGFIRQLPCLTHLCPVKISWQPVLEKLPYMFLLSPSSINLQSQPSLFDPESQKCPSSLFQQFAAEQSSHTQGLRPPGKTKYLMVKNQGPSDAFYLLTNAFFPFCSFCVIPAEPHLLKVFIMRDFFTRRLHKDRELNLCLPKSRSVPQPLAPLLASLV